MCLYLHGELFFLFLENQSVPIAVFSILMLTTTQTPYKHAEKKMSVSQGGQKRMVIGVLQGGNKQETV